MHRLLTLQTSHYKRLLTSSIHSHQSKYNYSKTTVIGVGNAIDKLRSIVEEYRIKNFTDELPSRTRKELLKAADINADGQISGEELRTLLRTIDVDKKLSDKEVDEVLAEIGQPNSQGSILVDTMMKTLRPGGKK